MTTFPPSANTLPPQHASQHAASQPSPSIEDYNTQIDSLLTRYLHLLDEYTTHRSSLSSLQAGMYQNLARANFAAERGVRYGKDYFDERMVASRRVVVKAEKGKGEGEEEERMGDGEEGKGVESERKVEFRVLRVDEDGNEMIVGEKEDAGSNEAGKKDGKDNTAKERSNETEEQGKEQKEVTNDKEPVSTTTSPSNPDHNQDNDETPQEKKTKLKKTRSDPLRWFGLLTPLPLRLAQTQAIQAVEQIIPRLVTVNMEMAQVEIEVRRARKRRNKAVKATKAVADSVKGVAKTEVTASVEMVMGAERRG